jgi:EamA-like transporter family.
MKGDYRCGQQSASGVVYLAVACYTGIIGFAFLFIKLALETAHPIDALAHRFTIALAAIAAVFLISRRRLRLSGRMLLSMLPLVLFYPFLFFTLQTYGLTPCLGGFGVYGLYGIFEKQ